MHSAWVAIRCEASRASEATPTVAEASEDTCTQLLLQVASLANMGAASFAYCDI